MVTDIFFQIIMTVLVNILIPCLAFFIESKIKNIKERKILQGDDNDKKIEYFVKEKNGIIKQEAALPKSGIKNKCPKQNYIKSCVLLAFPSFLSLISLILYYLFPVLTFTSWTGWIFSLLILAAYILLFVTVWKYYKRDLFKEFKNKKTTTILLSILAISICYTLSLGVIFVCFDKSITWKVLTIATIIVFLGMLLAVNLIKNEGFNQKNRKIYKILISLFCFSSLLTCLLVNAFTTNLFEFTNISTSYVQYGKYYYQKNNDGTLTFVMSDYNTQSLTVPEKANDKDVVGIKCMDKYYGSKKLKNLVIPQSIKSIDKGILYGCGYLQELTLPNLDWTYEGSVKDSGESAEFQVTLGYLFGNYTYENSYKIEQTASGKYISGENVNKIELFNATYYLPNSLSKVTVQGGEIKRGAFENCWSIGEIHLNDITKIEAHAFDDCGAKKNIGGLEYVDNWVVGGENTDADIEFAQGTVGIADEGLFNNKYSSIKFNSELKYIGEKALGMSENLQKITIPAQVSFIGEQAFYSCQQLKNVTFEYIFNWYVGSSYLPFEELKDSAQTAINITSVYKFYNNEWVRVPEI